MRNPDQAGDWLKGDHAVALRLDVTDSETFQAAMHEAISRFGAVDVLVNNAGYGAVGPFEASTPEQVDRQIATNVTGLMNVSRAFLPTFGRGERRDRQHRFDRWANHVPALQPLPCAKWAVEGFSEALVYELEPFGIRVKIIEPGPIKTDFYDRSQDVMTSRG